LLKGAFSPLYGNALSGVLDISLRKGNMEQREHSVQIGALGVEVSTEGPFKSKSNNSYLVNYRYSTLNILDRIGVNLNAIGKYSDYEDLAFNTVIESKSFGSFSLFGIGGQSTSRKPLVNGIDIDRAEVGMSGVNHEIALSDKTSVSSSISWSGTQISNDRQIRDSTQQLVWLNENYRKQYWRGMISAHHLFHPGLSVRGGITYSKLYYDFYLRNYDLSNSTYREIINFNEKGNTGIAQSFLLISQQFHPSIRAHYGVHFIHFGLTNDFSLEPRGRLEFDLAPGKTISLMAGKHSRIENLQYYLARDHREGGDEIQLNQGLGFTRSNHFGGGYSWQTKAGNFLVEGYYQKLYNAPVYSDAYSWYSPLNEDSGFVTDSLTNNGEGANYGIEISVNRSLTRGFYYLCNGSLYESRFGSGETNLNSAYNGNYIFHALVGKEFPLRKNSLWAVNIKGTTGGGRRYTPVDFEKSVERGYEVLDWQRPFEKKLPGYFRLDLQFSYKQNHEKYSTEFRIDIQNLTDHENTAYYYFDVVQQKIRQKLQVGILPVLTCRIDF
jgi:hypothetical protein